MCLRRTYLEELKNSMTSLREQPRVTARVTPVQFCMSNCRRGKRRPLITAPLRVLATMHQKMRTWVGNQKGNTDTGGYTSELHRVTSASSPLV